MIFIICLSLINFTFYDYFQDWKSSYNSNLRYIDIILWIVFLFELILNLIAFDQSFLELFLCFNIFFKFIICIFYLVYLLSDIKVLRLFACARVFCIIEYSKDIKILLQALKKSLWDIFQLFIFFFLFILLFSVIGVKFYKGTFWFGSNLEKKILDELITKQDCFDFGGDWINRDYNFDYTINGISLLFMVANCTGWLRIM